LIGARFFVAAQCTPLSAADAPGQTADRISFDSLYFSGTFSDTPVLPFITIHRRTEGIPSLFARGIYFSDTDIDAITESYCLDQKLVLDSENKGWHSIVTLRKEASVSRPQRFSNEKEASIFC
jgi:hypothetical protein